MTSDTVTVVLTPAMARDYGLKDGDMFFGARVVVMSEYPTTVGDDVTHPLARALVVSLLALALTACGPKRPCIVECPTTPVVVEVPVAVREPVPERLVEPVTDPTLDREATSVGEAVNYAEQRRALVRRLVADREQIRALQNKEQD